MVVENDEISTKIIKHLNSLKGGRVTFIPLNRVRAPHISYPQSSDVVPLLKKLKFSPNYTPAFAQVSICIGSLPCQKQSCFGYACNITPLRILLDGFLKV